MPATCCCDFHICRDRWPQAPTYGCKSTNVFPCVGVVLHLSCSACLLGWGLGALSLSPSPFPWSLASCVSNVSRSETAEMHGATNSPKRDKERERERGDKTKDRERRRKRGAARHDNVNFSQRATWAQRTAVAWRWWQIAVLPWCSSTLKAQACWR